jgi:hypothetical protein
MMIIDRQSKNVDGKIARFFIADFLGAEDAWTPRQRTERFYDAVIDVKNSIEKIGGKDLDIAETLVQELQVAIVRDSIDLDDWLGRSGLPEYVVQQLETQFTSQKLTERQFDLDQEYARALVQKRVFRGSFGLRVEVESDYYDRVVTRYDKDDLPPEDGRKRFIVTSDEWTEVKKVIRKPL